MTKFLSALFLLFSFLSLSSQAQALTGALTYTRPTAYTNGTALLATDITGYEFRCTGVIGTTAGVSCPVLSLPGTALSGTITVIVPSTGGTACFTGRAFVGVTNPSADSNISCKVFAAAPPNPPGNVVVAQVFSIGVNITTAVAYGEKADGTRNGPVVGFVPLGTPCIGAIQFAYRGQNYHRVDKVNVVWWNTTPTSVVDAPCSQAT